MSFKPSTVQVIKPVTPTTATFRDDIFKGKVVLSTGGRSGIVYKMIRVMMLHGADSVIMGRNGPENEKAAAQLSKETGRSCLPCQADVRKPEDLKAAAKKAFEKYGRIDFVICGAAGNFLAPIEGLSENAFKTVVDIDLLGTYNTIKATLPYVRETQGSYIHISATLHYRGLPWQAHVSAAKAGVDALSAVLAMEEGPRGVRSNVIAPDESSTSLQEYKRACLPPKGDRNHDSMPLGRWGDGDEIAAMAVFLFSDSANWITGQVFVVDGGENHVRVPQLPYPQAVLDPKSMMDRIQAKI
ncbi:hypothetical protein NliqN6_1310 [Naganishia liquefaciens]|uniref:2,4-dienoyl-CoA reductase [(3E)-enoyl-CoA-producing] n=1 Tax=Naganishia liquefaciens TaxID=104408 RepID=A0A8H3YD68_9TREE|nr:hypothetical protein NliqN6_1310 [Naganishia liquefaciens]